LGRVARRKLLPRPCANAGDQVRKRSTCLRGGIAGTGRQDGHQGSRRTRPAGRHPGRPVPACPCAEGCLLPRLPEVARTVDRSLALRYLVGQKTGYQLLFLALWAPSRAPHRLCIWLPCCMCGCGRPLRCLDRVKHGVVVEKPARGSSHDPASKRATQWTTNCRPLQHAIIALSTCRCRSSIGAANELASCGAQQATPMRG
jgi:hypothetical protein